MGRTKFYETVDKVQTELDAYLKTYNQNRPHQGRGMKGRTPDKALTSGFPKPAKTTKMRKTETKQAA